MADPQPGLRRHLLAISPWLRETDFLCDLRDTWGSGLASACGVMFPLSHAVSARLEAGNADGLADLFAFLDTLLVSDVVTATAHEIFLDEAVATCFFENIADPKDDIKRLYTPILGERAREFIRGYWPDCLAADVTDS